MVNNKLGRHPFSNVCGEYVDSLSTDTVKWVELGGTTITPRKTPTTEGSVAGFVACLSGILTRSGNTTVGTDAPLQLFTAHSDGTNVALVQGGAHNTTKWLLHNHTEGGDGSGIASRQVSQGLCIRWCGNKLANHKLPGQIMVCTDILPNGYNTNSEMSTGIWSLRKMSSLFERRSKNVRVYEAEEFADGKWKFFASVPFDTNQSKIMTRPFAAGSGTFISDFSGGGIPTDKQYHGLRSEFLPITVIGNQLDDRAGCWEIGYRIKIEALIPDDELSTLKFFATDGPVERGEDRLTKDFTKLENQNQFSKYFNATI